MGTELAVFSDLDEIQRMAKLMLASGYFEAQRDAAIGVAQLAVKILAGREMGYGPFASVQGIHVIQGKPSLSANLMAAAVKASPRYDYRVRKMDAQGCEIEFFQLHASGRESLGVSSFTLADAQKAGVKNIDKFPRNMLFARAMSNGVRWFCPDVFSGSAVFVPEELGATVDGDTGEIFDVEPAPQPAARPEPPPTNGHAQPPQPVVQPSQPAQPQKEDNLITEKQLRMLHALGVQVYADGWNDKRRELVLFVTKGEHASAADLTVEQASRLIDGLKAKTPVPAPAELAAVEPVAF